MQGERIDWPNGKALALSLVVNVEEGSELSVARGDAGMEPVSESGLALAEAVRDHASESSYLYGIKAGAPRLVSLLRRFGFAASWAVAAHSLEQHPELAEAIRGLGHEPVGHGWRWVRQHAMAEAEERDFIARATASIARTTGTRPRGWLSRDLPGPNTRRLLIEAGYRYHMDDYSGDVPFTDATTVPGRAIVVVPHASDTDDLKMWRDPGYTPRLWLDYARDTFDQLLAEGRTGTPRMMSLGLHLRVIGRPGRIGALEAFLAHVAAHADVWVATRGAIAAHHLAMAAADPG